MLSVSVLPAFQPDPLCTQNVSEGITDRRKAIAHKPKKIIGGQCAGDCQSATASPTVVVIELADAIQLHGANSKVLRWKRACQAAEDM